eukprot:TRINITY_DN110949_c0_g1_i1.p1 TRINITY_DN110949_c0_g1~~TRINITY_DN110949_c0_g1_i1.p1  ORF type:complete len:941 (-),score=308.86 TRINITY_DN110949_c0_g1_i1:383-3205(-)
MSGAKQQSENMRSNEINYLQEQNRFILAALERVEAERQDAQELIASCQAKDAALNAELQALKDKIQALVNRLNQDKQETVAKDEHVRVLSEQNKQMLSLLESEEVKSRAKAEELGKLETANKKLQKVADAFDAAKAEIERKVAEAKAKCSEIVAQVKSQRSVNEQLRAKIQNTEAKTRVDIEALGQALQVVDQKNIEYLARINKQEAKEHTLQGETNTLKEEVEKVRTEIDQLRKQLEGDQEGRSKFERARGQLEMAIQALEVQADTLKKALSTAERANEQLQDENRTAGERSRETADKVYALMDSLRLNQVELKKQEAENNAREKKIQSLQRQLQNLQSKIAMETDAKVLAEQERREAEQEAIVLKKKNKSIEEGVTASQQAQEKAEKEIHEWNERVSQMQTQNAYLASRIDGQEEEKNALRSEIKKLGDRTKELTGDNTKLRDEIDKFEEEIATIKSDKDQLVKELEYIKREDLDEAGRQRPILIQSAESDLLEKLQINEFLFEAQQARNPVPPLIEKVAQLLAMLHDGQSRADQYLNDLSKSNALVSALRQRNMALFTRTQMFESFKTRALLRYVMNLIEGELVTDLFLDSLSFGPREVNEMVQVLQRYDAMDKVYVISLRDNGLDDDAISVLLQLIFACPYLRLIDLRQNCISAEGCRRIEEQVKMIEGITTVIKSADGVLNCHSGNQQRLRIDLSEQVPKDVVSREIDFTVREELAHKDADPFLASAPGESQHPWTKTSSAPQMRSVQQAVPDASAVELSKPTAGPQAPVVGGPPVGLGGPGNVAALNKKTAKSAKAESKPRQARRAKGAPPPELEYMADPRYLDKMQGSAAMSSSARPSSSAGRSASSSASKAAQLRAAHEQLAAISAKMSATGGVDGMGGRQRSEKTLRSASPAPAAHGGYAPPSAAGFDRSSSMPVLKPPRGRGPSQPPRRR